MIDFDDVGTQEPLTKDQIEFISHAYRGMSPQQQELYARRMNALGLELYPTLTPDQPIATRSKDKGKLPNWEDRNIPDIPQNELNIENQREMLKAYQHSSELGEKLTQDTVQKIDLVEQRALMNDIRDSFRGQITPKQRGDQNELLDQVKELSTTVSDLHL